MLGVATWAYHPTDGEEEAVRNPGAGLISTLVFLVSSRSVKDPVSRKGDCLPTYIQVFDLI